MDVIRRLLLIYMIALVHADWESQGYKTSILNVQINPNTTSFYAIEPQNAINATLTFIGSSAFYVLRFIPAALWKQFDHCGHSNVVSTCTRLPSLLISNQSLVRSLHLANLTMLSNRTEDQVLPLALWADRSVLVFSILRLSLSELYRKTGNCARVRMCALPWELATTSVLIPTGFSSMEFLCNTALKQVHQDCFSEADSYKPLLMPLAHGLAIEVDGLGTNAAKYKPSLSFTASAGYSLPAGQFCCPKGLFACLPPSYTHLIANRSWSQRICLPQSLHCDGVINCPVGDADERNCASPPPVEFDPVPTDEWQLFHTYLHTVNPIRLVYEAGHTQLSTVSGVKFSLWSILMIVLLVFLVLLVVVLYHVQRGHHCSLGSKILYQMRRYRRSHPSIQADEWSCRHSVSIHSFSVGDQVGNKECIENSCSPETADFLRDSSSSTKTIDHSATLIQAPLAKLESLSQLTRNSFSHFDSFGVSNTNEDTAAPLTHSKFRSETYLYIPAVSLCSIPSLPYLANDGRM